MFEAKISKASLLKKLVDAIKDLVSDAPFDCTKNAMCLQAMDGAHVALVSMKLGVGLFDAYRCDQPIKLGLNTKFMAIALKCADNEDTCKIRYDNTESGNVLFTFTDEKLTRTQDVTLKLMDIDAEQLGVTDQQYSAIVEMSSHEFHKVVTNLTAFSNTIMISVSKGKVVFESVGGEFGGNVVTYNSKEEVEGDFDDSTSIKKDGVATKISVDKDVELRLSIKYMNQFAKATKLSERVRLSMSDGVPIVVEYPIEDDGHLKYYLAPKVHPELEQEEDAMEA